MTQSEKSYTIEGELTIHTMPGTSVIEFEGPNGNKLGVEDWLAAALDFTSHAGVGWWRKEKYGRVRMTVEQLEPRS